MSVADTLTPLLRATAGDLATIRVRFWDGSEIGPADAPLRVTVTRRALRRLLWSPDSLGLARAYTSGELTADGDLLRGLAPWFDGSGSPAVPRSVPATRWDALVAAVRLAAIGPPPRPPAEEARLSGRRHSRERDAQAIAHHYDVGTTSSGSSSASP